MPQTIPLPSIAELKLSARELRRDLAAEGQEISHSQALEHIAADMGFRDWNALSAMARKASPACPVYESEHVTGLYLGQPFTATVLSVTPEDMHARYRVTLHFDRPVDVVRFASFSSFRQRVSCTITPDGHTPQKTSDGQPHLILD